MLHYNIQHYLFIIICLNRRIYTLNQSHRKQVPTLPSVLKELISLAFYVIQYSLFIHPLLTCYLASLASIAELRNLYLYFLRLSKVTASPVFRCSKHTHVFKLFPLKPYVHFIFFSKSLIIIIILIIPQWGRPAESWDIKSELQNPKLFLVSHGIVIVVLVESVQKNNLFGGYCNMGYEIFRLVTGNEIYTN